MCFKGNQLKIVIKIPNLPSVIQYIHTRHLNHLHKTILTNGLKHQDEGQCPQFDLFHIGSIGAYVDKNTRIHPGYY